VTQKADNGAEEVMNSSGLTKVRVVGFVGHGQTADWYKTHMRRVLSTIIKH
jgi:hypothetical protein